ADIVVLADEQEPHPYWYACIIGIFHARVRLHGENKPFKVLFFLWVRWFERDTKYHAGWKA
ncbi:hypothetical protein GGX14DRAFT_303772, partial [Mycena pura]